jgi:hypothetical protein
MIAAHGEEGHLTKPMGRVDRIIFHCIRFRLML